MEWIKQSECNINYKMYLLGSIEKVSLSLSRGKYELLSFSQRQSSKQNNLQFVIPKYLRCFIIIRFSI